MWSYWAEGGNVRAEPFHNPLRFHADVHPPRPAPHLIWGAGRTDRCITDVSQMYHRCITDVSQMYHRCITDVSQMYHRCMAVWLYGGFWHSVTSCYTLTYQHFPTRPGASE